MALNVLNELEDIQSFMEEETVKVLISNDPVMLFKNLVSKLSALQESIEALDNTIDDAICEARTAKDNADQASYDADNAVDMLEELR